MTELSRCHNTEDLQNFIDETADMILDYRKDELVKAYLDDNLSEELNPATQEEADLALQGIQSMKILGRIYELLENSDMIRDETGTGDTIREQLQYVIYREIESRLYYRVEEKIEDLPEEELTAEAL